MRRSSAVLLALTAIGSFLLPASAVAAANAPTPPDPGQEAGSQSDPLSASASADLGDGPWQLYQSRGNANCLDAGAKYGKVHTTKCLGHDWQQWQKVDEDEEGFALLRNKKHMTCLDSDEAYGAVYNRQCQLDNEHMRWKIRKVDNSFEVYNKANQTCLDSDQAEGPVYNRTCDSGNTYRLWTH